MSKVKKLYVFNLEMAKTLNIGQFNPSCKAFIKGLYKLSKDENFTGITGEDLLKHCVEEGLWTTKQEPSKYHTTWAYYVKLLKEKGGVQECGTTVDTNVEFLEEETEELEYDFHPADKE
jgi:hypothetical protein